MRILKKSLKILGYTLGGILALVVCVLVGARLFMNGPRLGRLVSGIANEEIVGRIAIDAINWSLPFDNFFSGKPYGLIVEGVLLSEVKILENPAEHERIVFEKPAA